MARVPSSSADPAIDSTESQFLALINDYRVQNSLNPLVINVDLSEAADWYATDMATKNYFGSAAYCAQFQLTSHCDSYGGLPQHRISAFGYGPASISENAAGGFSSAQAVFDGWKNSKSGHKENMLRDYWVAIGIGWACSPGTTYGCYWVTDFGTVDSPPKPNLPYPAVLGTPTKTPAPTPAPSKTPTPTPSPSPAPRGLTWEDLNCDKNVLPQDAVTSLMKDAGLETGSGAAGAPGSCPALGENVTVNGILRIWGDIDCSGAINTIDSVQLLRWLIGLPLEPSDPACPAPGTPF